MIPIDQAILITAITASIYMLAVYVAAQIRRDTSIVDVAWGLGFVTAAAALQLANDSENELFSLVQVLVSIWGIRLFLHILVRKAGKPEDWRYQNWREQWGKTHWWRSLLQVCMLQGAILTAIAAPLYVAIAAEDTSLGPLAIVGAMVWLVGFIFEAVGDYQLKKFIADKEAAKASKSKKKHPKFLMTGLWRYTRHPNYFGEVTQWWGLWIIVASTTYGLYAIVSPLIITYLLLVVSGIPMLEKKWEKDREFKKYKKKTNAFFPGAPKKK